VAIAVGVLATALVEKPVLRLRDRLLPRRETRDATPAVRPAPPVAVPRRRPAHAAA
jgi:hypothetical protein